MTIVCLAMGIAAAVVVVAYVGFALSETRPSVLTLSLGAMFAVPHAILILAGMGAIQRLKRRYAAEAGQPFDTLPVIFLLVSLGLALGAVMAAGLGP